MRLASFGSLPAVFIGFFAVNLSVSAGYAVILWSDTEKDCVGTATVVIYISKPQSRRDRSCCFHFFILWHDTHKKYCVYQTLIS